MLSIILKILKLNDVNSFFVSTSSLCLCLCARVNGFPLDFPTKKDIFVSIE